MEFLQDFYVNITGKEEKNWACADMKNSISPSWKRKSAKIFCVIIH